MRPKLQKQSALKLAGRIIPRSGEVFNTPQLAAEPVSKACFGVYTRDLGRFDPIILSGGNYALYPNVAGKHTGVAALLYYGCSLCWHIDSWSSHYPQIISAL
jgi:hypothetical protein